MMSQIPFDINKINAEDVDREILRAGIVAEYDAVSLYEQLAGMTKNDNLKKVLADIIKEEKTHVGEFQALLLELDDEQSNEMEKGKNEVDKLTQ